MLEKLLATLAMCGLIVYLAVMLEFVRKPDLFLVIVLPVGIAIYGMWTAFREKKPNGGNGAGS